jgi:hypothetical protein
MTGRVNLNLPPRLIESARAAQYANREALGGRVLADKITAKVKARRAAALRSQPLPPDRVGGVLEERDPLKWRIWRKRRPSKAVDVGVGWLHIGQNYTITSNNATSYDPTWSNGIPGSSWDPYSGPTTRRLGAIQSASATSEFAITIGTRSGETWNRFRYALNTSVQIKAYTDETRFLYSYIDANGNNGFLIGSKDDTYADFSGIYFTRLWYSIFPAGQSDLILVVTIAQFVVTGYFADSLNQTGSDGSFNLQSTKQISFLVTQSSVTELIHGIPAFMQKQIDNELAANATIGNRPLSSVNNPSITIEPAFSQTAIGIYPGGNASSVSYEGIAPSGTYSTVTPQQAKASYAAYSGKDEIPVLRYKPNDPLAASTPTTEKGLFGIIPGASVTAPITNGMLAAGLDDELEQRPGPNAENQPEPVELVIAYDYHGGTYCRSRLAALGITLPGPPPNPSPL